MVVRHLETSPPTSASVRSRQSVWLRVFAETIGINGVCRRRDRRSLRHDEKSEMWGIVQGVYARNLGTLQ